MTIAHTEVVSEVAPIHVRIENEGILVLLGRVIGYKTHSGSESILGNYISLYKLGLSLDFGV